MSQQEQPETKKHGKITMIQTGTPKYSRKAEEKRNKIMFFVNPYSIFCDIDKLEKHDFFEIAFLIMRTLRKTKDSKS